LLEIIIDSSPFLSVVSDQVVLLLLLLLVVYKD